MKIPVKTFIFYFVDLFLAVWSPFPAEKCGKMTHNLFSYRSVWRKPFRRLHGGAQFSLENGGPTSARSRGCPWSWRQSWRFGWRVGSRWEGIFFGLKLCLKNGRTSSAFLIDLTTDSTADLQHGSHAEYLDVRRSNGSSVPSLDGDTLHFDDVDAVSWRLCKLLE